MHTYTFQKLVGHHGGHHESDEVEQATSEEKHPDVDGDVRDEDVEEGTAEEEGGVAVGVQQRGTQDHDRLVHAVLQHVQRRSNLFQHRHLPGEAYLRNGEENKEG